MTIDPIADMLTRIRNAVAVRKSEISVPYSKMKETVARVLQDSNFIDSIEVANAGVLKELIITINNQDNNARITSIERLSKPGRRLYVKVEDIPSYKQGRGIVLVSTSKGVMTGNDAKKHRLGGELICKVS